MKQQENEESTLRQSSRLLYAEVYSLKDTLYNDLLERFKDDESIIEKADHWKMGIMAASISTALFSSVLSGSKDFPYIYSYLKIKLSAQHPEGEAVIEDCMGMISKLLNDSAYHSGAFSEGIALWLYFSIKGRETFVEEETLPYLLAGQYINQSFYNWFDKQ
ncbi:hypothetical protein BK133_25435 [Paenibacillus sp. FSL H8-0548]|uniref:hypothetical protein n=1 Tax=Paenibacillus sp. FSL H8-0548 TaxID=1920422 RepID=UPI00096DB284|nr:hypothetical protein [Paenibacillus sp. FSL H8-0548]OMF22739.1 hypothetical protein BK133_25435 [Paenibacillus sp. FSL H8-0548]